MRSHFVRRNTKLHSTRSDVLARHGHLGRKPVNNWPGLRRIISPVGEGNGTWAKENAQNYRKFMKICHTENSMVTYSTWVKSDT